MFGEARTAAAPPRRPRRAGSELPVADTGYPTDAVDALAELRVYLRELLVRTEVAQLEILWEEKIREVNKIDQLLKEQREAVQAVEQRFRHVIPNN